MAAQEISNSIPAYKKRFIAEYYQLEDRIIKLQKIVDDIKNNTLKFELSCPSDVLIEQLANMKAYAKILIVRSLIEGININASIGTIYKEAIEMYNFNKKKEYMDLNKEVPAIKRLRKKIDDTIQEVKTLDPCKEVSIAITKLQEAVMWLGMDLKPLNQPNPYPSSKDPSTGTVIEPTADDLKF